jgi:DNA-binding NarL/FixJ family response regulator
MELNILIIDDHPAIIEGYKAILSFNKRGYQINSTTAFDCESAYNIVVNQPEMTFDVIFIDINLPGYLEKKVQSGVDLVMLVRKFRPESKIIVLTSHTEKIVIDRILNEANPEGLLLKCDVKSEDFLNAFISIVNGGQCFSETVLKFKEIVPEEAKKLDYYNQQIILLLSQGLKTKTIQDQLCLSKSAVDKRKVVIKNFFGIDKGNDEDILREARKHGLI